MKDWTTIQELLTGGIADFLSSILPEIGGSEWWRDSVVAQLTANQARALAMMEPGNLHGLDLAALIRVAERNWSEIAFKRMLKSDAHALLGELQGAWNRYAHAPASGVTLDDQMRDVDTVQRFLKAIGGKDDALTYLKQVHRQLLRQMLDSESNEASRRNEPPKPPPSRVEGPRQLRAAAQGPDRGDADAGRDIGPASDPRSGVWLVEPASHGRALDAAVHACSYIGIDFGTSTSVASVVRRLESGALVSRPLAIEQPEEFGGRILHHLVNTVLAWDGEWLLFGQDAYRLRQRLSEGRDVFSSFKMRLGVDIGPTWPATALPRGRHPVTIENANDATREFFKLLAAGIRAAARREGLPEDLRFAVTVPASFEANQRRDLLANMAAAGLPVSESCLIDEPNAAFLSFVLASAGEDGDPAFLERLRSGPTQVLVYDFGAGTCDVSVLEVEVGQRGVRSRNRAISRFTALGGDDLDRAVARKVLLPQLLASAPAYEAGERDIEERLVPWLQPIGERLKIAAIKWLDARGIDSLAELRTAAHERFSDLAVPPFRIRNQQLSLDHPSMTMGQFADALRPFLEGHDPKVSGSHVFAPVADALSKAGLPAGDLDAVLFIGGSAANPLVRRTVMNHLPGSVRAIVPADLRSHVSRGAAIHCLGFHAFGFDLIRPITPEPIFVLARGGRLETIVPASTEVPSPKPFETVLEVVRSGQLVVELPICVSNKSKLLGLLRLESPGTGGFAVGDKVRMTATVTHEKLLSIEADVAGARVEAVILNPLSNQELTPEETRMLEAKQRFNAALLASRGRPPKRVVLEYAEAALAAEAWETAADMFQAVERLDSQENHATNISFALSRANRDDRAAEWAKRAHERRPNATTAYNLACHEIGEKREQWLRKALAYDPEMAHALLMLGRLLKERGESEGRELLEHCVRALERQVDQHAFTPSVARILKSAAEAIGRKETARRAQAWLDGHRDTAIFDEENLAAAPERAMLAAQG